jgi:hypothetical protein
MGFCILLPSLLLCPYGPIYLSVYTPPFAGVEKNYEGINKLKKKKEARRNDSGEQKSRFEGM